MARQPIFKVDGNEMSNVLEVKYGINAALDRDGAPTRGVDFSGLFIRRVMDGKVDIADWASSADSPNRKSGEIVFMNADGQVMKTVTFDGAYVRSYAVDFAAGGDHPEELIVIEAEQFDVEGHAVDFDWKNK